MDQNVRQCRICKKLFQSFGNMICAECMDEMDKAFKLVRDYIYEHPHADILEISKNTSVSENWIFDFLKEERLELETKSLMLTCEQCGTPIQCGRYCNKCKTEFVKIVNAADKKMTEMKKEAEKNTFERSNAKMHVYVKHNNLNK